MQKIILIILPILLFSSKVNSQQDTLLTPMESAILELFDSFGISEKLSEFISHEFDSAMSSLGKAYPEVNLQMKRIIREESIKFIEEALSPKGEFFILISDVYSKYFTAGEIKVLAATIKSGSGINDSNMVVLTKVVTYKDSLSNDYTKATKVFMKKIKHKFMKILERRFENEGIINRKGSWMLD